MTENSWPQASDPYPAEPYGTTGAANASTTPGGAPGKTGAAKEQAANVAGEAADAAQHVTETAKSEAAHVASEVKTSARDLMHQAKSDLTSQADAQQQKAAGGIRTLSEQLRSMAEAPEQQGVASDLVRGAADRSASVATWLENRDPGSLLDEVKSFARQRPGTFLLLAASAGLIAGRLGRSLQAGAPAATSTRRPGVAPQHVQPPVPDVMITPAVGEPIYPEPALGETVYGEPARPGFGGPGTPGTPLRDSSDPYAEGGGRPL
ncbi:MAG: hypothetical protein ABWX85_09405 [Arthrobacter sp.]